MKTHNLKQYAVIIGTKCYLYKRPKTKRQGYTSPVFIGVKWFRSKAEAVAFKNKYDMENV